MLGCPVQTTTLGLLYPWFLSCRASKHSYDYVTSESLGRENYKEMYLFLYR